VAAAGAGDALTDRVEAGIWERWYIAGTVATAFVLGVFAARSIATGGMAAVHALDLDRFKEANDRFGHPVGDALLKQVAGRLKALAASDDLVVRMGGDEFVLMQLMTRRRWPSASCSRSVGRMTSMDRWSRSA
jgi:diguanylate cyclase (GGDEF)-like protein